MNNKVIERLKTPSFIWYEDLYAQPQPYKYNDVHDIARTSVICKDTWECVVVHGSGHY